MMSLRLINIVFLMFFNSAFSQGGWDIKYVPTSMVDKTFVGMEIRIDFKDSINDNLCKEKVSKLKVRRLLFSESTVNLVVLGESLTFKEDWNLYVDQGFLKDQFLVDTSNPSRKINQIYIEDFNKDSFYLRATYNIDETEKNINFKVKKKLIKGILIKE